MPSPLNKTCYTIWCPGLSFFKLFDYSCENEAEWIYLDGQMHPYYSAHVDIEASHKAYGDFIGHHSAAQNDATSLNNEGDISAAEFFNKHPEFTEKSSHIFNTIYCQTEAANLDTYGSREQQSFENSWECGPGNFRLVQVDVNTH